MRIKNNWKYKEWYFIEVVKKKKKNKTFDVGCIIKWDLKINKVVFWDYERPQNLGALKKEIWVLVRAPLFWGSGVELLLIFYTKKKRKKKHKLHDQNTSLSLIE